MKARGRLILHATFMLFCLKLRSQTLTCQYNCPQIGEIFSIKTCSPVGGASGLNQLWNFTQVQAVSTGVSMVSYVDPTSTSSSTLYPQADVARLEFGNYTFLNTGNGGVKLATANIAATVSAQSIVLPLPFSYGSSHTETVTATYLSGPDTIKTTSIRQLNAVGTGTLMLPTGTYKDVLRIVGQIVDSQTKNGLPYGYVVTNNVNYYYSEKISHPLLYSEYKSETGPHDYWPYTAFVAEVHTGVLDEPHPIELGIEVAPNPSNSMVRVRSPKNELGHLIIYNALGEIILNRYCSEMSTELDVEKFPAGLYTLQIAQASDLESTKLIVNH